MSRETAPAPALALPAPTCRVLQHLFPSPVLSLRQAIVNVVLRDSPLAGPAARALADACQAPPTSRVPPSTNTPCPCDVCWVLDGSAAVAARVVLLPAGSTLRATGTVW